MSTGCADSGHDLYDDLIGMIWYDIICNAMTWFELHNDLLNGTYYMYKCRFSWYAMVWFYMICCLYMIYDMMWYDMIWYDMRWYEVNNMIWYQWYDWYDIIRYWYDMTWYDVIWCYVMWCAMNWNCTLFYYW